MAQSLSEILKRNQERKQSQYKDRPIRPPEGKSIWRILPGWNAEDPLVFFHAFGQHYIKNTEGKIRTVIGCTDKTYDGTCEVCDMIAEAIKAAPDDETRKGIKDMRAGQTYLVNAVQVDKDKSTPVILQFPKTLFEQSLMDSLQEYGEEMLDLQEGNDIVISREGKGLDTKYSLIVRSQAKSTPIDKSIMGQITNLDEYVKDDFESKKAKAIEAIGEHLGELPSLDGMGDPGISSGGALTDDRKTKDADLDDDLGGYDGDTIDSTATEEDTTPPSEGEKKAAASTFNDEVTDEDLDDILANI